MGGEGLEIFRGGLDLKGLEGLEGLEDEEPIFCGCVGLVRWLGCGSWISVSVERRC